MVTTKRKPRKRQNKATKPWYQSKTIGFNALVIGATVVTSAVPALQQYMTAENYAVLANAVALGNAVLRLWTNKPIANSIGEAGGDE